MIKKVFLMIFLMSAMLAAVTINSIAKENPDEELDLYLGEVEILPVNNPTRIVISKPDIVDVAGATKDKITISPKAAGKTTMIIWDNFGEQSYTIKVFSENMQEIKCRVDNMLKELGLSEVHSQVLEEEGKVFLLGRVKNSQIRERLFTALGAVKDKIIDLIEIKEEEAVVEINVQLLELNEDATRTLGLSWPGAINLLEIGSPGIGALGSKVSTLFTVKKLQRATYTDGTAAADPFTFKLDALIQEGKVRILSSPRLACQSGKEAELLVGGEKPTFTTAAAGSSATSTNVEYKEYGIRLKIKPTVNEEKKIKLTLNVEVSEVGDAETIGDPTAPTAKAYPLTKRAASTELFLEDGQTLAIGGLIRRKTEEDIRKIPGLGDIPVFGALFRKKAVRLGGGQGERGDSELVIILTPKIVSEGGRPVAVNKKTRTAEIVPYSAEEPISAYARLVQGRILDKLIYPITAKQAGFQGTVKLSLKLSYQGDLLDLELKDTSNYRILDDDALRTAQTAGPYPPFPPAIKEREISVDIPITYELE